MDTENRNTNLSDDVTTKKQSKAYIVIPLSLTIVILLIVCSAFIVRSIFPERRLQAQLDLGYKYLSELNYERAIACFEAAIDINPKQIEAYKGLIDSYAGMRDVEGVIGVYDLANDYLSTQDVYSIAEKITESVTFFIDDAIADGKYDEAYKMTNLLAGVDKESADRLRDSIANAKDESEGVLGNDSTQVANGALDNLEEAELCYVNSEGFLVFGRYEQDGNTANGAEPIEWVVLDENENGMLVISRFVLDCTQYNTDDVDVTWETCSLRKWLNNDFINTAFTAEEVALIPSVKIINSDNAYYGTPGGNDTTDRVFCLSVDEIFKYFSYNSYYSDLMDGYFQSLIVPATAYAVDKGVFSQVVSQDDYDGNGYDGWDGLSVEGYSEDCVGLPGACWLLRSPGHDSNTVCAVYYYGDTGHNVITWVTNDNDGVRPALYVKK